MSKLITVFGATGNQGGSVIKAILADSVLSKEFKIRGITRDVSKPAAQALTSKGVEMTAADLSSKPSLQGALKGSHTVFLVTNYWETANAEVEITQGKNVADVSKELGVQHLIFSSLLHVTETSGGKLKHVPHFDGKAEIERYIKNSGVPCSFFLPGYFMSNYKSQLKEGEDGVVTLAYPVSAAARFPLLDIAEDTGKFVKAIIKNRDRLLGAHVYGAADYYTPEQILSEYAEVTGKTTRFVQVSNEQYMKFLPEPIAEEMLENHLFIESPGYYNGASLADSLGLLEEKPVSWKEFVAKALKK
ncbi:Family transcriptional regulator [Lasiodiplodia theobromae]|uniref:Family transcriptional regulator n=1 Tax=Lasiodiplodia theobromae TaxID=45133 RepID=UPI0015C4067A|nr:Family transcriptional regulator [Lasiodiplodia theobromae]KAF4540339.1 Family transcriptional regulator [Lasiodiplodia theobromae]